jgi:hypothetical protein
MGLIYGPRLDSNYATLQRFVHVVEIESMQCTEHSQGCRI